MVKSLRTGEIYPVILQRQIDPQVEIGSYKILQQYEGPDTVSRVSEQLPTEIASCRHYRSAADHFQKIFEANAAASIQRPSLFFVGEFRQHKLAMGRDGFPEKNSGILLSMGRALYEPDRQGNPYNLIVVSDPKVPTIINEPVLAQYNSQTNRINLMDGTLKPVSPGKITAYLDVEHFGFKSAITVEHNLKHSLTQTQKENHIVIKPIFNRLQ